MANEKNLLPGRLSTEEAARIGRLGGIASGEAKRQRKRMREYMETILDLPVSDKRKFNKLAKLGINMNDMDNEMLMLVALWNKACTGDVSAAREVRSIMGEDSALPPGANGEDDGLFDAIAKGVLNDEI